MVKVADTERDKNAKRLQSALATVGMGMGMNGVNPLGLQAAAYYQVGGSGRGHGVLLGVM